MGFETHELIFDSDATEERAQIGRFLRYAFPLGTGSFTELLSVLNEEEKKEELRTIEHA
jgi:hypothetical protein